jgi:hypothetical protein
MRLMAVAIAAAFAVGAVSAHAQTAPKQPPRKRVEARSEYVPGTIIVHRGEDGRTRTKVLVQKRSYLDGGTEVMPGDVSDHYTTFIDSFSRNPSMSAVSNDNVVPSRPINDPFFLPGKDNPYFR